MPDHPGRAGEDPEWEPPDWLDAPAPDVVAGAAGLGEIGPPLPVDPLPDWALSIAA